MSLPLLFDAQEKQYTSFGLGVLGEASKCTVTEERNGEFELELEYPQNGYFFKYIDIGMQVLAPTCMKNRFNYSQWQPFRIYSKSCTIEGNIKYLARHISYQLSFIPVKPFTAENLADALAGFKKNALETCPFTIAPESYSRKKAFKVSEPASIRSLLGGTEGSILDVYGGEYEWDRWKVKLHWKRGTDSKLTLMYGKNLTDFTLEQSIENVITGVIPLWKGSDGEGNDILIYPTEPVQTGKQGNYAFNRTVVYDFSSDFESQPTLKQLTDHCKDYISEYGEMYINHDLKFYNEVEEMNLCDTVHVIYEPLNIYSSAQVVKLVYNVLSDIYDDVEVGDPKVKYDWNTSSWFGFEHY